MLSLEYRTVDSRSRPNIKHTVTIVDWVRPVSCSCENWQFNIKRMQPYICWHMEQVCININAQKVATTWPS